MTRPTTRVSIPQSYFLEALISTSLPSKYLDNFSEDIYNTSPDSRFYKFLYSLLGAAGLGQLKINYFYARLQFEEHGLNLNQLDKFYGNPLRFGRSTDELYTDDYKGLLSKEAWDELKSSDQSYKTRTSDYMAAARMGPTPEGMRLAAKSGLGHDAQIVENYKSIFNEHTDQVFDYNFVPTARSNGTYNLEEFTVLPNDNQSTEITEIDSEIQHLIKSATDNLKPINTIQTIQTGLATTDVVQTRATLASSEFHQTVRLVTGAENVPWPTTADSSNAFNSIYWIESGVEKQAPRSQDDFQQHYQGFHKPKSITASSQHIGQFNTSFVKKIPFLSYASSVQSKPNEFKWEAKYALADYPEHLTVTTKNANTNANLINYSYPADYLGLEGVPTIKYDPNTFWASQENLPETSDTLIIDLGEEKAVNFILLEALGLPISISIEYDAKGLIDTNKNPQTEYKAVTLDPLYPTNHVDYNPNTLNKWNSASYIFTDANKKLIFTRFIKITFTKNTTTNYDGSKFLFDYTTNVQRPWSVIIKNLRLGRNV
jgi:hypothetical protein